jgi:uncharacterized membrane protein
MLISALLVLPDIGQVDAFAEPWRRLYSHSALVSTLVLFAHLAGLLAGGGLALAADRATLRADPSSDAERQRSLDELARTRRPVAAAIGVALSSGLLLFFADVEAFAVSWIFWAKMALVVLLLGNALAMVRVEAALRGALADGESGPASPATVRLWRRRRASAAVSAVLWFALVLAGTALGSH